MNKKISLGVTIALVAIAVAVTFSITMSVSMGIFNDKVYNVRERENLYNKIAQIDAIVRQNYVGTIDEDQLMDSVSLGYLVGTGDEHAMYYTAKQYSEMLDILEGRTVGIGVDVTQEQGSYLRVTDVYPDSPAESNGIKVDDIIVQIDDTVLSQVTYEEAQSLLNGSAGSTVTVVIRRDAEEQTLQLTRREVEKPTVKYRMIGQNGYIQITEFSDVTVEQFKAALEDVTSQGATGLIFDVRNNSGGTVYSVGQILDVLLPAGEIVSAVDRNGEVVYFKNSDANEVTLPMVVLQNENTASAAELFAQALKDYNKARLVGTVTYGKGTMQELKELDDGSAVSITVAYYKTAKSENFDKVGVKPDFEVTLTADQQAVFQYLSEENDPQFIKAQEVLETLKRNENISTEEPSSQEPSSSQSTSSQESSQSSSEESSETSSSSEEDTE